MTHPQDAAGAAQPTPEQLNRISSQLRDLNAACSAAIAANSKAQGTFTPGPMTERRDDRDAPSWSLPLSAAATTAVNVGSCRACRTCESAYNGSAFLPAARARSGWRGYSFWVRLGRARGGERRRLS